ncbi:uncharacterized F-box/LRR-repeat protein C02F5.7 [Clonorchis sinensis]|uniref:Uncharacterized F-box/LRR-repeat protein C02F5.7 n=1 Tax=Clonorchis sinensis TaxID=79923 RepID=G7YJV9_CLOSI|nr:uncharacterized F-box/LRR-repeat protein C02F5.7 [Clonorchis sinensis]
MSSPFFHPTTPSRESGPTTNNGAIPASSGTAAFSKCHSEVTHAMCPDVLVATTHDPSLESADISYSVDRCDVSSDSTSDQNESVAFGPIQLLPAELLLTIFSFLSQDDLIRNIPTVCRLWHFLSLSPVLRKRLVLRRDTPAENILRSFETRPMLEVFRSPALDHADPVLPVALRSCPLLRCLDIGFCTLGQDAVDALALNLPPTLRHLNLEGVKNIGLNFIKTLVDRCPALEALNLSHCVDICDGCVQLIAAHLHSLQRLNLDGVPWLGDVSLHHLVDSDALQTGSLSAIWLDGFELSSEAVRFFTNELCALERRSELHRGVQILWISFCDNLNDSAIQPIGSLTGLTALTMRKAQQVTPQGWHGLFPEVLSCASPTLSPPLSQLEHLDLSEAPSVDDNVVAAICRCCGPKLRSLNLNWCWDLTDSSLDTIVDTCSSLRHLSLVGDHLIRGRALVSVPTKLPHLNIVNLTQCNNVEDAVLEALASRLPQIYVFDYFGERVGGQPNDICHYDLWRSVGKVPICSD